MGDLRIDPKTYRADIKGLKWKSKDVSKDFIKISVPMLSSSLAWGLGFSKN